MKKKIIGIVAAFIFILTILTIGGGFYMLDFSLKPADLQTRARNIDTSLALIEKEYPHVNTWLDSLLTIGALHDMYIENDEGENRHALFVAGAEPTPKTAIIVHGYTDNSIRMMMIGYLYNKVLGYNILLPDLHGHGLSDGDMAQMGWKDRLDVINWIETADELFGRDFSGIEVVVHGISMGAATTMMVAGEIEHGSNQLPYVKCFVEDCGYTSVWDEFSSELKAQFGLPTFPLLHFTSWLCKQKYGWSFQDASALEAVKKSTRPMLFIHGEEDTFVPTRMVYELYDAKSEPKEIWISPGVDHAHSYRDCTDEYTHRVSEFVEKYIQ